MWYSYCLRIDGRPYRIFISESVLDSDTGRYKSTDKTKPSTLSWVFVSYRWFRRHSGLSRFGPRRPYKVNVLRHRRGQESENVLRSNDLLQWGRSLRNWCIFRETLMDPLFITLKHPMRLPRRLEVYTTSNHPTTTEVGNRFYRDYFLSWVFVVWTGLKTVRRIVTCGSSCLPG